MSLVLGDSFLTPLARQRPPSAGIDPSNRLGRRRLGARGFGHANRVSVPLSRQGSDGRGDGGGGGGLRRLHPVGPRVRAGAGRFRVRPGGPGLAAEGRTSCARSATRASRCCVRCSIRAPVAGDPGAGRQRGDGERADRAGRARIGAFLAAYLGQETRGEPRFHYVPGHGSAISGEGGEPDQPGQLARLRSDVSGSVGTGGGFAPMFVSRRAGLERIRLGGTACNWAARCCASPKRIARCPATESIPYTGERDADPVAELRELYGHVDLGIHAEVIEGGQLPWGTRSRCCWSRPRRRPAACLTRMRGGRAATPVL